jgi:hypothetical protein
VAAEIEAVAVAHLGLGDTAHLVFSLEDDDGTALPREQVAGRQAGRATAENGDGTVGPLTPETMACGFEVKG